MQDIIGALLSGTAKKEQSTGNPLADGILGGGGPMSGILGSLMGGSSSNSMASMLMTPIVKGVVDKLGLPPMVAQIATAFIISKISGDQGQPAQQQSGILDVLGSLAGGGQMDRQSSKLGSITRDLSKTAGIKEDQAAASIESVLGGLLKGVGQLG
jgi:hypothetical protein